MGIRGARRLRRKVRRMKRDLGDEVADAVERGARRVKADMQRRIGQQNAVWRGNLYRSLYVRKKSLGDSTRFSIGTDVPYAAFVEFGTGARGDSSAPFRFQFDAPPHTPELTEEITEWVMTKPVFFGPRTEAVAWSIARSISRNGTHAHPYMRPAWFRQKPAIVRDAGYAARKVVRR